jgi:membrane-bound ClpP family serine protease
MAGLLFAFACVVLFVMAIYLTLARCYSTGFAGVIGLALAGICLAVILLSMWEGVTYTIAIEIALLMWGIAIFMGQHVARVVYYARRDRREARQVCPFGRAARENVR